MCKKVYTKSRCQNVIIVRLQYLAISQYVLYYIFCFKIWISVKNITRLTFGKKNPE